MSVGSKRKECAWLLALVLLLSSCGGSDGGPPGNSATSLPQESITSSTISASSATAATIATCPASDMACSGDEIVQVDHGIAVTAAGVQVYGTSTNDLLSPNPAPALAYGLRPASGGMADVRVTRAGDGRLASVTLLLSRLGLSWDGKTERPIIIETFSPQAGRVALDQSGLARLTPLPASTDLRFFDFATKGAGATQAHYANNIYFPRDFPARCPKDHPNCPNTESTGLTAQLGDWRNGGEIPDNAWATRLHADGATQAGFAGESNGQPILLVGADGPGVPYPGFKGYRDYHHWAYAHANLGAWITQDTVLINEWGGNSEHNKMRRGLIAFGTITAASDLPSSGIVRYRGRLYGWFSYVQAEDSYPVFGEVDAVVDFAKQTVTITFAKTRLDEGKLDPLPLALTATATIANRPVASYLSGPASNTAFSGGIGARFFGPVVAEGSGRGPAEIGGIFQLQTPNAGPVAVGGFLLRKI